MPGLVRKLLIYAAVDGLVLQPIAHGNQRVGPAVKIDYRSHGITRDSSASLQRYALDGVECHGIIGFLRVSSFAFLITIARAQQVAQLWGKNIYVIKDIGIIPVSSESEARDALISSASTPSDQRPTGTSLSAASPTIRPSFDNADGDSISELHTTWLDEQLSTHSHRKHASIPDSREPGVAEEVIGRRGVYGRFAESWFSRRGWLTGQRRNQGMSSHDDPTERETNRFSRPLSDAGTPAENEGSSRREGMLPDDQPALSLDHERNSDRTSADVERGIVHSLMPKLLHTIKLLFSSDTFYFSYDFDITRSLAGQDWSASSVPLSQQSDHEYFWNRELTAPFVEHDLSEVILPIMQGFVGQRSFALEMRDYSGPKEQTSNPTHEIVGASSDELKSIEEMSEKAQARDQDHFLLTLISRRSTKRPGLRYLRRGIDDAGSVANSVETEQILSRADQTSKSPICSFLQTRGSLPLFFSQTPYTFKPVPVLHGSKEANQQAFVKHFGALRARYGEVQAVSLVDKTGVEAAAGNAYEDHMQLMNSRDSTGTAPVHFNWFDFHHVCRGMRFENVNTLIGSLGGFLKSAKWTTLENGESDAPVMNGKQLGIVRTNCMDCLDRTNVVQSAIAQYVLSEQLTQALGTPVDLQSSSETTWFNALWADNGDAVSRAYAGTAALKGDYTRTKQRNIRGVLTDFSLTLSRYYRNLFDDFFAQAVIDRLLGNVTDAVFAEFEATMTSADPGIDLEKARQTAIASASKIVVEHDEDFVTGWALASPASTPPRTPLAMQLRATPFSHVLLLLSDRALYRVQYDWDNETVVSFERNLLANLKGIQWGTYITETMNKRQMDPERNAGILIAIAGQDERLAKVSTGSLENTATVAEHPSKPHHMAFKSLSSNTSVAQRALQGVSQMHERQLAEFICHEIAHTVQASAQSTHSTLPGKSNFDGEAKLQDNTRELKIEEKELVSVAEAERATGYVEQLGYNLKKLVWG